MEMSLSSKQGQKRSLIYLLGNQCAAITTPVHCFYLAFDKLYLDFSENSSWREVRGAIFLPLIKIKKRKETRKVRERAVQKLQ